MPTHDPSSSSVYSSDREFATPGEFAALLRRLLILLTHSLLATCILLPVAGQEAANPAGYAVRGTVVSSVGGTPVARAMVELNAQYAVLTDAAGQFSFDHLPGGLYMVSVQKPGYLSIGIPQGGGRHFHGFQGQELHSRTIRISGDTSDLRFALTPAGSIAGQVTLSNAEPPDGIRVFIYRRQFQNGRPLWVVAGTALTRSDGTYRLGGLAPGSYTVNTEASVDRSGNGGFIAVSSGNQRIQFPGPSSDGQEAGPVWGYPPLYYPGVTDPNAAGIVTLGAGQQAEADFTLARQQFFPVTIAVRGSEVGMPAEFDLLDPGARRTGVAARYVPADAMAHANVPSGSWIVDARGFGKTMTWGRATLHVGNAPATVTITLEQIPRIPLVVHRDFSQSQTPPDPSNAGLALRLVSADPFSSAGGGGFMTTRPAAEGGGWQVNVTEPGRYWIDANAFPPAYISSITSGGVDLTSNPLAITSGSTPAPIEVTLRDDSGKISGQISGGGTNSEGATQPTQVPPTQVCAIPLFPTVVQMPVTMTASDGSFTFASLAPGSYRIAPCDSPQTIDFHSTEGLSAWTGKGQAVTVTPGGTAQVSLPSSAAEEQP